MDGSRSCLDGYIHSPTLTLSEVRVVWPTVERAAEAMHAATEEGVGHGLTVDGRFNVRDHVAIIWLSRGHCVVIMWSLCCHHVAIMMP